MRWIEYDYLCNERLGITVHKKVEYNERNLAIAQAEAIDGYYEITEDDEAPVMQPLAVSLGGTGARTADEALRNLGVQKIYWGTSDTPPSEWKHGDVYVKVRGTAVT